MVMKKCNLLVLALMLMIVVGCGTSDTSGGDILDGTSWKLFAYRKSRPIEGTTITANFKDGEVRGKAGCNSYTGSYQVDGDRIQIGELALTLMACLEPEGVMEQEQYLMQFLQDAQTLRIAEGRLFLRLSNGEELTFDPQE
jgi:heat shock protein HslJ